MAEHDLTASILAIASTGTTLSVALSTFSESVATASSEIKSLACEVSLISSILTHLGQHLKQDASATPLHSGPAAQTAQNAVTDCEAIFKEINEVLAKATESVAQRWPKKGGKVALSAADRLKWPFLQPRIALLRGNLERVKSTLVLMVNVLTYARDKNAENDNSPKNMDLFQKTLLENLMLANQQATGKYETLLKTAESQGESALLATAHALYQDPSSESELAPSVRHALKHVEHALLQYERFTPSSYGKSRVGLQIELEKGLARTPELATPWILISIARKERQNWPSQNDSWIPSEGDVYGGFAGGAIEGLAGDDHGQRSPSPSRVRFQEQEHGSYQEYRRAQPGPSRRTDRGEGEETVGLIRRLTGQTDPLESGAVKFQKGATKTQTWFSSLLDSIPSPNSALSTIQKTVKTTGLFLGLDEEKENSDTVLEYKNSRLASPPGSPSAKLVRSTTFDEMLRSPSSEGTQFTPPSTIVSKEEAPETEKLAEVEIKAPQPTAPAASTPVEKKIPFLVPKEDDVGGASGRATPDPTTQPGPKVADADGTSGEASEEKAENESPEAAGENDASEKAGHGENAGEIKPSQDKGKAKEVTSEDPPDEVDRLLKEWTTAYQ